MPPDLALLKGRIRESRMIVERAQEAESRGAGAPAWEAEEAALLGPALLGIPDDFGDRYVEEHVAERYRVGLPRIELDPKVQRFEDDSTLGILGWLVFNGPEALDVPRSPHLPFREQFGRIHGAEAFIRHGKDGFVYALKAPQPAARTRLALFADFGTGLAHSRFIARQLAVDRYDAAFHLGDVYYTGTPKEYRHYFEEPLAPALDAGTPLYVIPDNHDGYSGFHAYVDFLKRRLPHGGSYFAVETEHVQLIGVDTIWHSDRGRIQDAGVREWLAGRFAAGRAAGRANVLLTGHEPYAFGKDQLERLNEDVLSLANGAVDLWFWGNTHYCALFDRGANTPYYGSCIGHAGYPYKKREKDEAPNAAPVLFVETGSRYEGSGVRPDRGMNGFCSLEIEPSGDVGLRYVDWRGRARCVARFARQADGSLQLVARPEDLTGAG